MRAIASLSVLAVTMGACARDATPPRADPPTWRFAIAPPPAGSWMLHVEATFERAPSDRLAMPQGAGPSVREVRAWDGRSWVALGRDRDGWAAPACRTRCTVAYDVDLDALSSACRELDCGKRIAGAFFGSAGSWMLLPDPAGDARLEVRLRGGDPSRFVTGLRRTAGGDAFVMQTREFGEASYTAFGALRSARAAVAGATLEIASLGAEPLAMGDDATRAWVTDAATCVASLYGRFPCDAAVFVVPIPGADELVFGRVLSLAGASVALLFGESTPASGAHGDWVAVHELFHLGTPSFVGEGHWLEEGLATYYEPILRERAGWMSEEDLFRHFVREMPRGLRRPGAPASLEERDDIDSTYWGGALFAITADVAIHDATRGTRSLDDSLRAALDRLGDASHAASVEDFLRVGDEATGTRALHAIHESIAVRGESVDLDALWRSLGVDVKGDLVTLRDDTPRAATRRAIAGRAH